MLALTVVGNEGGVALGIGGRHWVTGPRAILQLTGLILAGGTVGVAVGMEQVGALSEGSEIGRTGVIE
jgi:hypothetical protein